MTVRMSAAQALSDGVIVDNEAWLPLITEWPKRSIAYFSDGYPDPVSLSHGSLAFQLGDDFDNQHWSRYDWDGALLEIYIGESGTALSQYRQIFAGTAGPIERDGNIAKVALRGPEAALETNILTNEYLGTGGAEGDANLTGNVKPKAFGKCFNIAPVLIDSAYQIYQFHDGAAAAVHGVYENGYPIAGSAKATVTTYSALANLTLTVGEYAIAPAAGMIRLGGQPRGKVTADITGANGTTIASIVKALLTQFGAVYNATSLNAWNQEWNLYLTDQMSVGDAVRSAFDGQGFLFPDSLGRFRACNFYGTTKTPIALRDDHSSLPLVNSVKQLPSASPAYGVRVGHTRTWAVHSASEISEAIRDAGIETANAKEAARLAQEAADEAKADAAALKVRIDDFAEDGKLSSAEKLIIIQRMAEFNTERPSMEADADRYSITTAKTNYQSKLDALNAYLASLSPAWNNVAVSTPIVRNTFKAKFTDFTTARVALLGKFADAASSITGSLTNDSHVLIANSAGTVSDFSDANGVFTVMKGIADVTSAATFTKVSQTGCTATIGTDGYYSVTAMSADKANVKLRATYEGVSINKTFTLAKARAGAQGSTGPAGAAGAQGNSLYTWIAYANNSTGTSGFATGANTGQTYIGIANNKTTETESTNPADYTWSRITGTDGVRGSDGADGQPTYTWFAYANNSTGTSGFTTGDAGTRSYVGIAANKNTPVEGTNPADYNWAKIQGDTGPQGPQGPTGNSGAQGPSGPKGDYFKPIWRVAPTRPSTPTGANPNGWSTTYPTSDNGQTIWKSEGLHDSNNVFIGPWGLPLGQQGIGRNDLFFDTQGGRARFGIRDTIQGGAYAMVELPDVSQNANQQWSQVSGAGRPADNATRNTGALADLNAVDLADSSRTVGLLPTWRASSSLINSNVSINSDGRLFGAGGGQVTIGGLGYSGDLNADRAAGKGLNFVQAGAGDKLGTVSEGATASDNLIRTSSAGLSTQDIGQWQNTSWSGFQPPNYSGDYSSLNISDGAHERPAIARLEAGRYRVRYYLYLGHSPSSIGVSFGLRTATGGAVVFWSNTARSGGTSWQLVEEYVTLGSDQFNVCLGFDLSQNAPSGNEQPRVFGVHFERVDRLLDYIDSSTRRITNTRALPPVASLNLGYKFTGNITYSATAGSPARATISVSAGQALVGTTPISYNSMSANVSGSGGSTATYHLYVRENSEPTAWGGSKTLIATTSGNAVYQHDDNVWIGSVTGLYPSSGSGSGGGSSGGGGGTPYNPNNPPTQIP